MPTAQLERPVPEGRPAGLDRFQLEEPPEVVGQIARRVVPLHRLLGHRLQDDRLQVDRHGRVEPTRRARLLQRYLAQQLLAAFPVEGRLQRQQLVERHAQRVDVAPMVDDRPLRHRLLGAHVSQRPDHVAGHRQAGFGLHPRQAEVGDPEVAPGVDQQVGRLDVAVDDPQRMRVIQRLGRLHAQVGHGAEIGAATRGVLVARASSP